MAYFGGERAVSVVFICIVGENGVSLRCFLDKGSMKIVIVGTAYPYRGGLAAFNERLARQFLAEGHEVHVVTFTLQYPSFLFPGKTQYSAEAAPEDLKIVRRVNSCNPLNWIRVGKEIRKMDADLLITCYWMAFMAPCFSVIERIVKKNKKTRCVGLVHNMIPHEPSILDKVFAPYYVASTDAFVALSESVVHDIERLDKEGKPKAFSPHPIYDHYGASVERDEALQKLGLPTDRQYVLFFGLVRAYKGLDLLLEAMGQLRDTLPAVDLIVAGEFYEDEAKYRAQIEQLGLKERVHVFNEFIPDDDIRVYFSASDIVAQPYKSATQSGVTQVAFHFEKPMLVTNVGGLGEIVHHGKMGYAVEVTPKAIAEAIQDFYQEKRTEAFTAYVREEKKKYEWDKMSNAFYTV